MPLHIVVCVKHTPAATGVAVDPVTGKLKTEGLLYAINPFDEYAVEEALRLKERVPGSTVTALSFGPPRAEEAVRSALALGCDQGVLVSDPSFEDSDPSATAYLLSRAIAKLASAKPVHLALFGKQTNDGETGQVGPAAAAWLDWPAATFVKRIEAIDEKAAKVQRLMEDGTDTLELQLPAAVCVIKEINEPRLPSLKGKMASKKAVLARWGAAELQADAASVGAGGSPTAETKTSVPPARGGGIRIEGKDAAEKAAALVDKLKDLKVI